MMAISLLIASKRRVVGKEGVLTGTIKGRMRRREGGHAIHRDTKVEFEIEIRFGMKFELQRRQGCSDVVQVYQILWRM
jgi:hypothetical protein